MRFPFFEFNEFQIRQKVLYVPATTGTVKWGYLPNGSDAPVASMEAGSYLVVDALSHEGILEDQGRDPLTYFSGFGVQKEDVLNAANNQFFPSSIAPTPVFSIVSGPATVSGKTVTCGNTSGDVTIRAIVDGPTFMPIGLLIPEQNSTCAPFNCLVLSPIQTI